MFSKRPPGGQDYSEWYSVVLTPAVDGSAAIEWSIGTGARLPRHTRGVSDRMVRAVASQTVQRSPSGRWT